MAYNTSVKYFHSGMAGAPSLTGAAGALLAILDACLVNGFGSQTASLVTVAGGVATVTVPSTHPFDMHTVVLVSGATPSGLNGEKRVLSSSSNAITFDATGVADGTATGTISVKLAAAGWLKPFSGTNLGAYRVNGGTGAYLRVDDTGTTNARVFAFESMNDVNTGSGQVPTATQVSGGAYWCKANAAGGSGRAWIVVSDDRTVWIKVGTVSAGSQNNGITYGAGDFLSRKAGDAFSFALWASPIDNATGTTVGGADQYYGLAHADYFGSGSGYALRAVTGFTSTLRQAKIPDRYAVYSISSGAAGAFESGICGLSYPNPADNSLLLTPYAVHSSGGPRGMLRGALFCPQTLPSPGFAALTMFDGQGDLNGRKILTVPGNTPAATVFDSRYVFFDITGPWG